MCHASCVRVPMLGTCSQARVPAQRFRLPSPAPTLEVMKTWVQWAREGVLARSPRPGFAPGAEFSVRREAVEEWITHTRALGIASIICLLDRDQLPLYERAMPGGLLARYTEAG